GGVPETPDRTGTAPPGTGEAPGRRRPQGAAGRSGGQSATATDATDVTPEQRHRVSPNRRHGGAEFPNPGRDVSAPAALPGSTREEGQNCGSEAGLPHGREDDSRGRSRYGRRSRPLATSSQGGTRRARATEAPSGGDRTTAT